jgi:hypothetical protein
MSSNVEQPLTDTFGTILEQVDVPSREKVVKSIKCNIDEESKLVRSVSDQTCLSIIIQVERHLNNLASRLLRYKAPKPNILQLLPFNDCDFVIAYDLSRFIGERVTEKESSYISNYFAKYDYKVDILGIPHYESIGTINYFIVIAWNDPCKN